MWGKYGPFQTPIQSSAWPVLLRTHSAKLTWYSQFAALKNPPSARSHAGTPQERAKVWILGFLLMASPISQISYPLSQERSSA
jgi:hypothetical protein